MQYHHPGCRRPLKGLCEHESTERCTIYCKLSEYGWYWGSITSHEAVKLLARQQDSVFLVRDSSDLRHILCVSLRHDGRTIHIRLNHSNGLFSLDNETFVPPCKIAIHCITVDVFTSGIHLKMTKPLNRFATLDTLQMICRFVIRKTVPENAWIRLPLPPKLIDYICTGTDYILT